MYRKKKKSSFEEGREELELKLKRPLTGEEKKLIKRIRVRNHLDVIRLIEKSLNDLLFNGLDPDKAHKIGFLCSVCLRALQQGDMHQRLRKVEEFMEDERSKRARARPKLHIV